MEKHCRLGDLGLLEVVGCAFKHHVGNIKSENLIGLVEHLAGLGIILVKILAHAGELRSLAGKYKSFFTHFEIVNDF